MSLIPFSIPASGQTEPPPFGGAQWTINDNTVIKDRTLRLDQSIVVNNGGSLTFENGTLLMQAKTDYSVTISIMPGGSFIMRKGSYLGAFDSVFFVYAHPGSTVRISNSTVSRIAGLLIGSSDVLIEDTVFKQTNYGSNSSYGVVIWGGKAVLRRDTFYQGNFGVWNIYGDIEVHDSTFDGMSVAVAGDYKCGDLAWIWVPPWDDGNLRCYSARNIRMDRDRVLRTINWGLQSYGSESVVRNSTFMESAGVGIYSYPIIETTVNPGFHGSLRLEDSLFRNMSYGLYVDKDPAGWSPFITLINNDFLNCYNYAIHHMGALHSETWTISSKVHIDSSITTRQTINIVPGGDLVLQNTSIKFKTKDLSSNIGLNIFGGGAAELDGVAWSLSSATDAPTFLKVHKGGSFTARNSTFDSIGFDWGTSGEIGGLYSEGETELSDVEIANTDYGIITNGGHTLVRDSTITTGIAGLNAVSGHIEAFDSSVSEMVLNDVHALNGQLDLYNMSFNKMKAKTDAGGRTQIFWPCDLATMWQNGRPLGEIAFDISEKGGVSVANGTTTSEGTSEQFYLRESIDTGAGAVMMTPHKVYGISQSLGVWNTTNVTVDKAQRVHLYLKDNVTPFINVTSPGLVVYQKNNTLNVNGTAYDKESGLDRVEWSYDQDLWYPATGLNSWNLTVALKYGTTTIFIRAVDLAGNQKFLTVHATIDKEPPYLLLILPHNGFVTSLGTVLVEGLAEMGSDVKVGPLTIRCLDGTFRMTVPLSEGINDIQVTATAPSGLFNSTTVRVIRDSLPPLIVITSPHQDYITNRVQDRVLPISGRTEPDAMFYANGKLIPLAPDGSFAITVDIVEGLNIITFVANDKVGNQNSSVLRVVFDIKAPSLSVYSPIEGSSTNRTSVLVTGLSEPGMNITGSTLNGTSSVLADSEGGFELYVKLAEGPNNLTITAKDEAGNTKPVVVRVIRDTIPPAITLNDIKNGMVVQDPRIFIEGQTEPGAKVKLNGELIDSGFTGQFSRWVDLPSADNTLTFEAVDKAGNRNVISVHIIRKPQTGPVNPGVREGPDYFPWIALIVIILTVVEIVLVYRHQRNRALSKASAEAVKDLVKDGEAPRKADSGGPRVAPRRGRPKEGAVPADEQEFEIEYGDSRARGGGQR